jgi:hypothetical protein
MAWGVACEGIGEAAGRRQACNEMMHTLFVPAGARNLESTQMA